MMPELGIKNGQLAQCPNRPNCVSSQSSDKEHYIEPIVMTVAPAEAKNHILTVLNQFERTKIIVTDDNYVRVTFTSRIFRFVDDMEFYFPDVIPQGATSKEITIHIRSASRVGYSDLGANRKRIERIRRQLESVVKNSRSL